MLQSAAKQIFNRSHETGRNQSHNIIRVKDCQVDVQLGTFAPWYFLRRIANFLNNVNVDGSGVQMMSPAIGNYCSYQVVVKNYHLVKAGYLNIIELTVDVCGSVCVFLCLCACVLVCACVCVCVCV